MTDCRAVGDWLFITDAPVAHLCTEDDPCEQRNELPRINIRYASVTGGPTTSE